MEVIAGRLHKVGVNETGKNVVLLARLIYSGWSLFGLKEGPCAGVGNVLIFGCGTLSPDHVAAALWAERAGQAWDYSPFVLLRFCSSL